MGEDLLRKLFKSKIKSSDLRECHCPYDHKLTNKAYLSGITVRNIYESLTHNMAAKTSWHRYGTKLRHCRPMYCRGLCCCQLARVTEDEYKTPRHVAPWRTGQQLDANECYSAIWRTQSRRSVASSNLAPTIRRALILFFGTERRGGGGRRRSTNFRLAASPPFRCAGERCDMLCTSGFVNRVMSAHYRPGEGDTGRLLIKMIQGTRKSELRQRAVLKGSVVLNMGWLGSRVVNVLDSSAEGPGFKSQSRRCRVTVLGKLFTPIVPLFTKQQNW